MNTLKISKNEFWVLSSGALVLRDIYDKANDLDIAVTDEGLRELKNNYNLNFEECLFIDDNINNIKTATKLGIKPGKVNSDDYNSIVEVLRKYNIKGI